MNSTVLVPVQKFKMKRRGRACYTRQLGRCCVAGGNACQSPRLGSAFYIRGIGSQAQSFEGTLNDHEIDFWLVYITRLPQGHKGLSIPRFFISASPHLGFFFVACDEKHKKNALTHKMQVRRLTLPTRRFYFLGSRNYFLFQK